MSAKYQYRVVDKDGHHYPSHPHHLTEAQCWNRAHDLDRTKKSWGPHSVQRRQVSPWETITEDGTP